MSERSGSRQGLWILAGGLAVAGVTIRLVNAVTYPQRWGFDVLFNERYVRRLLRSWELPAPDADWATAHPPLFYYLSAGLGRLMQVPDSLALIVPTRIASTLLGLSMAGLCFVLLRRARPHEPLRAVLGAAIVLFLPAQIYMSAMLNEEILAATFVSIALFGVCLPGTTDDGASFRWRDVGIGLAGGLALLTKLSGLLVIAASVGSLAFAGWRTGRLGVGLRRAVVVGVVAFAVGGWFYGRNLAVYGYLYPEGLSTHALMFSMPPGERRPSDYLYFPAATFHDPQVLNEDLLRSVWGSTYLTWWYEGQGHFIPVDDPVARRLGTAVLLLALLPTLAFAIGFVRAIRRAWGDPRAPELPLALLTALTGAGYVVFTWRNPWFATVKASYMLGISIPFAYFASEVLSDWIRSGTKRGLAVGIALGALCLGIGVAFTMHNGLWELDLTRPGVRWEGGPGPTHGSDPR